MSESRATLRRELRTSRRALPAATRIAAAEALAERILALPFLPADGDLAGYWAMDGEIALHVLQLRLPRLLRYCLPVLGEDGRLRFARWSPGEPLVANRHGIPEPDTTDLLEPEAMALVVVPLVGFDHTGHRLGMGGGWYDRSFAFRNAPGAAPPPWLVGAGFHLQQVDALPPEAWDVPLDAVCTERDTLLTGHR